MKKIFPAILLMSFCAVAASVAAQAQNSEFDISVREKKITDLSPDGLSLVFYLDIANKTPIPQFLAKYDYRVVINETEFLPSLQVPLDEPLRIEPKSGLFIALPVKITFAFLFQAMPDVRSKDRAACFLTGGMIFQDEKKREKRISMAFSGDFPVYRGLDVKLLPVEAKDLTVGGADLVFKAALMNPNGFSFKVEKLTYTIELVGMTVSQGSAGRGADVAARGEKTFEIPLLLDFFEIGRVVYDGLEQPPVAARFSGEAEIETPWGNFKIPLEKSGKIAVQKIS